MIKLLCLLYNAKGETPVEKSVDFGKSVFQACIGKKPASQVKGGASQAGSGSRYKAKQYRHRYDSGRRHQVVYSGL